MAMQNFTHAAPGNKDLAISVDSQTLTQSPFERKAIIIDTKLNRYGMGRYQWFIWTSCGCGYLIDVMWAVAFGFAATPLQQELGFSDKEFGDIFAAFHAGLTVGAFVWGALVDVVGRRLAFLCTVLISGVFGICLGALSSYSSILAVSGFLGFGVGGNIPVDTTVTAEFLPEDKFYLLAAVSLFQPFGVVFCTLIAFAFIPNFTCASDLKACHLVVTGMPCCAKVDNMGWRYLGFTLGGITLAAFLFRFFLFEFQESPKFLLSKGKDEAAVVVIKKIAAFNGHPCDLTIESLRACNDDPSPDQSGPSTITLGQRLILEFSRLKILFTNWTMTRITVLVWVTWMFDYWGFTIAGAFLPTILQKKNAQIHVGLRKTYINYLIAYFPGIFAVVLGVYLIQIPVLGRKWTMVLSSALMGVSLFLFSIVDTEASYVGINALVYFFQSLFNAVLFGWTPDAFPSAVRGTASGLSSFWGNLFSIASPIIAGRLYANENNGSNSVLFLAGAGMFVCTLCLIMLPAQGMASARW